MEPHNPSPHLKMRVHLSLLPKVTYPSSAMMLLPLTWNMANKMQHWTNYLLHSRYSILLPQGSTR